MKNIVGLIFGFSLVICALSAAGMWITEGHALDAIFFRSTLVSGALTLICGVLDWLVGRC